MKLAYLISRYPAISHTFILREIRLLRTAGFEIKVASMNGPDRDDADLTAEELGEKKGTLYIKRKASAALIPAHMKTFCRFPLRYIEGFFKAIFRSGLYGALYFAEAVMVGDWMKEKGLQHLHIHFANPAAMVGMLASKIFSISYSMTVHGPTDFKNVSKGRLAEKVENALFVVCISEFARSEVLKTTERSRSKLEVVPLGVEIQIFPLRLPRGEKLPVNILCVGRIVSDKGQKGLIDAVELLIKRGHDILLRLVGDGPDREMLEQEVRKRGLVGKIRFEGAQNQNYVRERLNEADIFALASFAEGVPVSLMEAMATGVPCVTTAITGIPELIEDGVSGLLVPPGDSKAFADALERLITDIPLKKRIISLGRKRVEERYDLSKNVPKLAATFRKYLGASHE